MALRLELFSRIPMFSKRLEQQPVFELPEKRVPKIIPTKYTFPEPRGTTTIYTNKTIAEVTDQIEGRVSSEFGAKRHCIPTTIFAADGTLHPGRRYTAKVVE